jgi:UMF1 family MFS transporter
MSTAKNDPRVINGWCMYDWANSVYALTITTAIFPTYFLGATGGKGAITQFFGWQVENSALYSYAVSITFLVVALLNPFLSAMADYKGNKKSFMRFFATMGALACGAMFFFGEGETEFGTIAFVVAGMGFAGSLVYYNSYLPEIATEDQFDRVSAKGFTMGYIGSVVLLILNLMMVMMPSWFFISESYIESNPYFPSQLTFVTVMFWWLGFGEFSFSRLPTIKRESIRVNVFSKGIEELKKVWCQAQKMPLLKKFLLAFFLYSIGVQTVMYMATIFGEEVVGMEQAELIGLVLVLQLVAIGGAYVFSLISKKKGNVFSIQMTLLIWIGICIGAFFIGDGMVAHYFVLGFFVGLVMGGVQSMSRSTYAKLIPEKTPDTASFFSFFETLEKISIALGAFIFGFVKQVAGTLNASALVLSVFFIAGLFVLMSIPSKQSYQNEKN